MNSYRFAMLFLGDFTWLNCQVSGGETTQPPPEWPTWWDGVAMSPTCWIEWVKQMASKSLESLAILSLYP